MDTTSILEKHGFSGSPHTLSIGISDHQKILGPRMQTTYAWIHEGYAALSPVIDVENPDQSMHYIAGYNDELTPKERNAFFRRFCPDWLHKQRLRFQLMGPEEVKAQLDFQIQTVIEQWLESRVDPKLRTAVHMLKRDLLAYEKTRG